MNILVVAEKPSIAEAVASAFSSKKSKSKEGKVPVWVITANVLGTNSTLYITSTTGHIFNINFSAKYNNWESTDPVELFAAPVVQTCVGSQAIANHLSNIAKNCNSLILALDNDREGENICFEVINVVKNALKSNSTGLGKNIFRARFSSLVKQDIIHAFNNLGIPNKNESDSVLARQEIDLKLGCSFTRFQTLSFKDKFGNLNTSLISYGPCQTPTLFFCVQRFKQIKSFQSQTYYKVIYYYIEIVPEIKTKDGQSVKLTHSRGQIFNLNVAEILLELVKGERLALSQISSNTKHVSRPTALNTVNLLKMASVRHGLSPHSSLSVAERLYLSGYISYPRTETTSYPDNFNTNEIFNMLKGAKCPQDVFSNRKIDSITFNFKQSSRGKDAGDHPPITPTTNIPNLSHLSRDELNVYMLVVTNFLASICTDCKYKEDKYIFIAGSETFSYTCNSVIDPGFSFITGQSFFSESTPIDASIGDFYRVSNCEIVSGQTTPPSLLSESDLLELMEKNGIGTDTSMATHINNICLRGYVKIVENRRLEPTVLGQSLIYGYLQVDPELVLPKVRGNIEGLCDSIATGKASLDEVIQYSLDIFKRKFIYFVANVNSMVDAFMQNFTLAEDLGTPLSRCGICNHYMLIIKSAVSPRLVCKNCDRVYKLPTGGSLRLYKELKCPLDNFELVQYQVKDGKAYTLCPMCYNDPPFEDFSGKVMDCSVCLHPVCPNGLASIKVAECECGGALYFDTINQGPKWRILCNNCSVQYIIENKIKLRDKCKGCGLKLVHFVEEDLDGCLDCDDNLMAKFSAINKSTRAGHGRANRGKGFRGRGRGRGFKKKTNQAIDPKMTFNRF